jgi:hypothetical protein
MISTKEYSLVGGFQLSLSIPTELSDGPNHLISIHDDNGEVLSRTGFTPEVFLHHHEVLISPDGKAFILYCWGWYDDWYQWICYVIEVSSAGSMQELYKEERAARSDCVRLEFQWLGDQEARVVWKDPRSELKAVTVVRKRAS